MIRNKKTRAREAYLNTEKIKKDDADAVAGELTKVAKALKKARLR